MIGMQKIGFGRLVMIDEKIVNTDQIRYAEAEKEKDSTRSYCTKIHFVPGGDEREVSTLKVYGEANKIANKLGVEA